MRRLSTRVSGLPKCIFCAFGRANPARALNTATRALTSSFQNHNLRPGASPVLPQQPTKTQLNSTHSSSTVSYKNAQFFNSIHSPEERSKISDHELVRLIRDRCFTLKDHGLKLARFKSLGIPEEPTSPKTKKEVIKQYYEFLDILVKELDTRRIQMEPSERVKKGKAPTVADTIPSLRGFREVFKSQRVDGIDNLIKHTFLQSVMRGVGFHTAQTSLASIANFRDPQDWDTRARGMKRSWHLHVGPTNSGKTYHALKRLEETKNGIYAGPLRLLAHEIYEKFNSKGIPCNLITGEEQRLAHKHAQVASCTVEMINTSTPVEVAVIDEIQMIGDIDRGGAWTSALLGVKAKEVHLCGEERATELIEKLCALCGDELHIHRYKRLGPLEVQNESLYGDVSNIQPGDCYVAFSRRNLYIAKAQIEKATGMKCAIIYGGLPPEVRSQQAALFNDPESGYDVLVASDAVGMGLNLSIKRVVLSTMRKWNGEKEVPIPHPMVRQIAGRAGRYKVLPAVKAKKPADPEEAEDAFVAPGHPLPQVPLPPSRSVGLVTTLEEDDLPLLKKAMESDPEPIETAGLDPTPQMIENYVSFCPEHMQFSDALEDMRERIRLGKLFHLCDWEDKLVNSKAIDHIKSLTYGERLMLAQAPLGNNRDPNMQYFYHKFCEQVAQNRQFSLLDLSKLPLEELDKPPIFTMESMKKLEDLHKITLLWLWLSYRFPYNFRPKSSAMEVKRLVEERIDKGLEYITTSTLEVIERMKKEVGFYDRKTGKAINEKMVVFGRKNTFTRQLKRAQLDMEREANPDAEPVPRPASSLSREAGLGRPRRFPIPNPRKGMSEIRLDLNSAKAEQVAAENAA